MTATHHREGKHMGATENSARIRAGYEAFNRGDVEALIDLFAEDMVWHFPGSSKLAGEHVGRDACLALLGAYGEAAGGTLQATPVDVMASDERVTGWANDTASARDRTLDINSVVVFTMRDGKVVEARHFVDDQAALDAFLA
jgi:ketosteroid isomerase-like protein